MNGHFLVVLISPAGSAAAERTEGEPPGDRSGVRDWSATPWRKKTQNCARQNAGLTEDLPKAQPSTPDLSCRKSETWIPGSTSAVSAFIET
jgi:hypothetical protein